MLEKILSEHGEGVIRKCIVLALQGDRSAMRLCMERLLPARHDALVSLPALRTQTGEDIAESCDQLLRAIGRGRITPAEGELLVQILAERRQVIETTDLAARLEKLEALAEEARKN